MLTADLLSSLSHQLHKRTNVKVYTAGVTQIGIVTLGQRFECFTFPAHQKIGDALESKELAGFSTSEEFAEDLKRPVRYLPVAERPHYLVHKDGSVALG